MSPVLRLLSTSDEDLSINVAAFKDDSAAQLDSLSVVKSYSHALINTNINPVSSPPESWYTPLAENLGRAKTHASTWLSDMAPNIGSKIPQSIINYSNDFEEATKAILEILGPAGKVLSPQEKSDVIALIEAVLSSIGEQKSTVDAMHKKIVDLSADFAADHEALVNGQNSAARAVTLAEGERTAIEGKIGELQTKLAEARAKVTASGIGLGAAIFLAVAAFALAAVTGGTSLIVAGAIGVVGVGVAATFTGIFTAEISALLQEIQERQSALEAKKRQVTALKGLHDTMQKLKTDNEDAKKALTNVLTMWTTLGDKVDAVLGDLKRAKISPSEAVQRMKMNAARTAWADTAAWAGKIQALAAGTTVQPVIQHDAVRLAYRVA
jgi:hypothetical protein